jgi:hypothetical protein
MTAEFAAPIVTNNFPTTLAGIGFRYVSAFPDWFTALSRLSLELVLFFSSLATSSLQQHLQTAFKQAPLHLRAAPT